MSQRKVTAMAKTVYTTETILVGDVEVVLRPLVLSVQKKFWDVFLTPPAVEEGPGDKPDMTSANEWLISMTRVILNFVSPDNSEKWNDDTWMGDNLDEQTIGRVVEFTTGVNLNPNQTPPQNPGV